MLCALSALGRHRKAEYTHPKADLCPQIQTVLGKSLNPKGLPPSKTKTNIFWVSGGRSSQRKKIILGIRGPVKHSYTVREWAYALTRGYISRVLQEKIIWKLYEELLFTLKMLTDTYLINQVLKILGHTRPEWECVSTKGQLPDSFPTCT